MTFTTHQVFPPASVTSQHVEILYRPELGIPERFENGEWYMTVRPEDRPAIIKKAINAAQQKRGPMIAIDIEPWASVRAGLLTAKDATDLNHALCEAVKYTTGKIVGIVGPEKEPSSQAVFHMYYAGVAGVDPNGLVALDALHNGKNIVTLLYNLYASGPNKGKPVSESDRLVMVEGCARYLTQCNGNGIIVGWDENRDVVKKAEFAVWFAETQQMVKKRVNEIFDAEPKGEEADS